MKIGKDKIMHFLVTSIGTIVITLISDLTTAVSVILAISIGKELYDILVRKKDLEIGDLAADFIGIIVGILIVQLIIS